jgi:hypothetical protein
VCRYLPRLVGHRYSLTFPAGCGQDPRYLTQRPSLFRWVVDLGCGVSGLLGRRHSLILQPRRRQGSRYLAQCASPLLRTLQVGGDVPSTLGHESSLAGSASRSKN